MKNGFKLPSPRDLLDDALAGLTGAVAGAPQAMAFALIAGVSPIYGLYAAVVATIVGGFTMSSAYLTVVPTNALALVVASALMRFDETDAIESLFVLTLLVGVFQLAFGLLKLGSLTRFVSNAVMTGFISGAGVLIIIGQLPNLTGYATERSDHILLRTGKWAVNFAEWDTQTALIGMATLAIIYAVRQTRMKSWAVLTALVITGAFIAMQEWQSVAIVSDITDIPRGLPDLIVPDISRVPELWSVALAMAVLALVQSAGMAQNIKQPDKSQPNISQDFMAQGVSNVVSAFFQGMPNGGSLSRTAININAGAKSRYANVFAGVFIGLTLLALAPAIEKVALAALAAQLILAAISLIKMPQIRQVWDTTPTARLAMGVTFLAALTLPLEFSIYIGVGLTIVMYAYTSSSRIDVKQLIVTEDNRYRAEFPPLHLPSRKPVLITVHGNLYFAAVDTLEKLLPTPNDAEIPILILRLHGNHYMGSTGIRFLERYADELEARGGLLILCGVTNDVAGQLRRTGALERFGKENVFFETDILLASTESALARAHDWLAAQDSHFENVVV